MPPRNPGTAFLAPSRRACGLAKSLRLAPIGYLFPILAKYAHGIRGAKPVRLVVRNRLPLPFAVQQPGCVRLDIGFLQGGDLAATNVRCSPNNGLRG